MARRQRQCIKAFISMAYLMCVIFPVFASANQITLKWTTNGLNPDGYNIYQRLEGQDDDYSEPLNTTLITDTRFTVTGLTEGQSYFFIVRAVVSSTESVDSNEVKYTHPYSNPDTDNDGYNNSVDAFPYNDAEWLDTDNDGKGNNEDIDDDGDGLPDAWEYLYGLDPLDGTDGKADPDNDGITNLQEYNDGTDPSKAPQNELLDPPILTLPPNGATAVELMPTLMTAAFKDINGHSHQRTIYQIATSTDWIKDLVFECEFTKHLTSTVLGDLILDPETTYYWRARFINERNETSQWSAASSFTTIGYVEAGFSDGDGDGILDEHEVAEDNIDPQLGATGEMLVLGTSDEINPQLGVLLSSDADMVAIRSTVPEHIEVGDTTNRPDIITGLVSFKVMLLNGATSADVTVVLSEPAPTGAVWYKYNVENGWVPYPDVTFGSDRKSVTIHLVDGGAGDDDGVQNGIIVDPSGLGYGLAQDNSDRGRMSHSNASGGGGCFIAVPLSEKF